MSELGRDSNVAAKHFTQAAEYGRDIGHAVREGRARFFLSFAVEAKGDMKQAVANAERAVLLLKDTDAPQQKPAVEHLKALRAKSAR